MAHHTLGGCNLRPGDLLGTGTLSSAVREGLGRCSDRNNFVSLSAATCAPATCWAPACALCGAHCLADRSSS